MVTGPPFSSFLALEGFFRPVLSTDKDDSLFKSYALATATWAEWEKRLEQECAGGRSIKVVYLVRHAEGFHNAAERTYGVEQWEKEIAITDQYLDADLTLFGISDAQAKGPPNMQKELERGMPRIERVIVSPLSRAIQTAQHFYAKDQLSPGQFVAMELCREKLGRHYCDKRRPLTEIRSKFPSVDFSAIVDEEDVLWSPTHRETDDELRERAHSFLHQLFAEIPQRTVTIVTHSGFISAVCSLLYPSEPVVRAANCEVIPLVLEQV